DRRHRRELADRLVHRRAARGADAVPRGGVGMSERSGNPERAGGEHERAVGEPGASGRKSMSGRPFWREYPHSGPIAVEGGIKARSKRGAIGEQWWSRRFIAFLESSGMSGRLQRGRSYARRGQVIEFSVRAGKVTARVQGSRPQPYQVSITVR